MVEFRPTYANLVRFVIVGQAMVVEEQTAVDEEVHLCLASIGHLQGAAIFLER